jgi:hypothetical protein
MAGNVDPPFRAYDALPLVAPHCRAKESNIVRTELSYDTRLRLTPRRALNGSRTTSVDRVLGGIVEARVE